jgi:hypothetical protein
MTKRKSVSQLRWRAVLSLALTPTTTTDEFTFLMSDGRVTLVADDLNNGLAWSPASNRVECQSPQPQPSRNNWTSAAVASAV